MWPEAFDCVLITSEPGELPLRLEHRNGTWARLPGVMLMSGLALLVVAPQLGLALYALAAPDVRHAVAAAPIVALELAMALIFWIVLVCWPLRLAIARVSRRRGVEITGDVVRVEDTHPFGGEIWTEKLAGYAGVAHHVRSSLSGVRHELVLVHAERGRSILLCVSEQITERDVDAAARLLRLPKVAALELYEPRRDRPLAARTPQRPAPDPARA